ncbi:MAG: hypothetical protein K5831_06285 [Brevundimonas sp.]|jgi:hypothetical protein|uniref:hypothetical protein n=1 Tax=Brevundimonas sp. TaxID=1871086 RepID=UPI0025863ABF|nr:hypothetical protein [Brevundimonas sp.]MCV0414474.1 hypothetical protein [Brevundimonas sp.]
MTISVQSAKNKGRNLQKLMAAWVLGLFPDLEPDDARSCPMGSGGEDVQLSPAARKLFPYSLECKARKSPSLYADYDQAARHCAKATTKAEPLVVTKGDRRKPLVTMSLDHFETLLREAGRC